ncbi:hypothetical protein KUDE01_015438 [Dissostichus eleginoides]|uniref:Adrenomedullin n=1 Tax=Dissostichus eleginoides TaxID=100907 RepID=A0AAD9ES70_DISEL|nr:hypothetical protein KUDE01_015438 [Dissostichus eleginoides]
MQLIFQSFLSCCLLATVAHCVELEVNPELKKSELSTWLGSRLRRDFNSVSVEKTAEYFVRPEDIRDTLLPHSSTHTNVRTKRSKNSSNHSKDKVVLWSPAPCTTSHIACTCSTTSLRLGLPLVRISAHGYGRRRRSLPVRRVSLRLEQGRLRPMWSIKDSQVHKLEALLRRT